MCGIYGVLTLDSDYSFLGRNTIQRMQDSGRSRGPDSNGFWSNEKDVYIGHNRLSINDLSQSGNQPMYSPSKRYVIAFNGEIYNYKFLRNSLTKPLVGHSDTEVLIHLIEELGLENSLDKIQGMYSISLYDTQEEVLYLCRDKFGEKPLYYFFTPLYVSFASELRSLLQDPSIKATIDYSCLPIYLSKGYIPAPLTPLENIFKVKPAHIVRIAKLDNVFNLSEHEYFSKVENAEVFRSSSHSISFEQAVNDLDLLFSDLISSYIPSDVPVGSFLSGGIDSSLLTTYLSNSGSLSDLNTFSVGFDEHSFDETSIATSTSKSLSTTHHSLHLSTKECYEKIDDILSSSFEPFADSSFIPTYFLSQLASEHVKVAISGDGADELFCGYSRYSPIKQFSKNQLSSLAPLFNLFNNFPFNQYLSKVKSLGSQLTSINSVDSYQDKYFASSNYMVPGLLNNSFSSPDFRHTILKDKELSSFTSSELMMFSDIYSYLPDDILFKVDRASMAHSLEVRAPFLSDRIFNFAFSIPFKYKSSGNMKKAILKHLLSKYMPDFPTGRKKTGFGFPLSNLINKYLFVDIVDIFNDTSLPSYYMFEHSILSSLYQNHISGSSDNSSILWSIYAFKFFERQIING